jgi:hypothetical protein
LAIEEAAIVLAIGVMVGTGELVARYRDDPFKAVLSVPAGLYVVFNAAAAISALALIRVFGWQFGLADASEEAQDWIQVIVAGFGAMALFRSSLFVVRIGDEDVGVGPSGFLQVMLIAADRGVDRSRAKVRAAIVTRVMKGVSYDKANAALPSTCIALMQNLSVGEQEEIKRAVSALTNADMEPGAKVLALGLLLMNYVGDSVLEEAVRSLGDDIKGP